MRQLQKKIKAGKLHTKDDDPFESFISTTNIRYTYYAETHKILGNTYGMCVLQVLLEKQSFTHVKKLIFSFLQPFPSPFLVIKICSCIFCQFCCFNFDDVFQDFEALTPNLLARTIETVEGGGLIILLLRSVSSLRQLYTMTMVSMVHFAPL